jgi:hypothetical protein
MLLVVFFMMAVLTGVRWNLSVVLICISFMGRGGQKMDLERLLSFCRYCPGLRARLNFVKISEKSNVKKTPNK